MFLQTELENELDELNELYELSNEMQEFRDFIEPSFEMTPTLHVDAQTSMILPKLDTPIDHAKEEIQKVSILIIVAS